jgi:biopolymer transport protein ExbD
MASMGNSEETISINITPMMDVFSILITFLLISYSTDPVVVDPREGLELPRSQTFAGLEEIPALSVTKTAVYVNDKKVADIVDGDIPLSQRSQGAIQAVYDEMKIMKEAGDRIAQAQNRPERLGRVTMEMDKTLEFVIARRLMLSAQQAEFVTFNLMVFKEQ